MALEAPLKNRDWYIQPGVFLLKLVNECRECEAAWPFLIAGSNSIC
jgi:hypothetical protein